MVEKYERNPSGIFDQIQGFGPRQQNVMPKAINHYTYVIFDPTTPAQLHEFGPWVLY